MPPQGKTGSYSDKSHYYLKLTQGSKVMGVVGYSDTGEHLTMDFYHRADNVSGIASRGFYEMVSLALELGKGVHAQDNIGARPVYSKSGLEQQEDGHWEVDGKTLSELFGKENDQ
jgi:recombinational DNA repair ATPase RecF